MKFLVLVASLIVIVVAETTDQVPVSSADEQPAQPYSYSYNVQDSESSNDFVHSEDTDGKVTTGSYRVALPDGRIQIVTYRADHNGYTADVKYEGYARYPVYEVPSYKN